MGKIIFIFVLIIFIQIPVLYPAQNLIVFYDVKYRPAINDSTFQKEDMILTIDTKNNVSLFESHRKIVNDSVYKIINSQTNHSSPHINELQKKITSYSFFSKIYKDPDKESFFIIESIMRDWYKAPYEYHNNWKLLNSQKDISGYICKNAVIELWGRKWIAWYTTEIPISDGPYKFRGLPGLILEVTSVDKDYSYRLKSLYKNNNSWQIILPQSLMISQKKLTRFKEKIAKDPSASFRQTFINASNMKIAASISYNGNPPKTIKESSDLIDQDIWNWIKTHNNPIEKGDIWLK